MLSLDFQACICQVVALCKTTSAAILPFYGNHKQLNISEKSNNTPLTQADIIAHHTLYDGLAKIINIPVVSEESDYNHNHKDYWLIDPIDGTREFINQTDEFCIAIARIENHRPTLGIIYAPVAGDYWYAGRNEGAYKVTKNQPPIQIHCRNKSDIVTLISAQRKISKRVERYFNSAFGKHEHTRLASALKFCHIAEGKADIYPKISATTSEWDTAAGDILLQEAGGGMHYFPCPEKPFFYGQRKNPLNPPFIAYGGGFKASEIAQYFAVMRQQLHAENRYPPNF